MKMLTQVKSPNKEPISLEEVKTHLRLDQPHEDHYLLALIQASRQALENYLGRSLLLQTWQIIWRRHLPSYHNVSYTVAGITAIELSYPPLVEVVSVSAILPSGLYKPLKRYTLEVTFPLPKVLIGLPVDHLEITYNAGYGDKPSDVPMVIRHAILMMVGDLYENRTSADVALNNIVQLLIQPYRIVRVQ